MPEEETKKEEKKAPRPKPTPVHVVKVDGKAALVEYVDGKAVKRVTVPTAAVEGKTADKSDLEAGIPYGVPWDEVKFTHPTGEQLANALHNAGIWTAADVTGNPKAAIGVIQGLYGVHLATLYQFAREHENGGKK